MNGPAGRMIWPLWGLATIGMFVAIHMVFRYAPDERTMGAAQRIFYFHVPAAIVTFLAALVLLVGAVGYLLTRSRVLDNLSRAAAEIGLLFCSLVLITGPIWAKPAWGIWWSWEARLTTTLVLWLLLVGCLMVRSYAADRELGARLAAVVGIVAAVDVPIIYKAVDWWRGQHPVVFGPGREDALDPRMRLAFLTCLVVFIVLFGLLLALRYAAATIEDRAAAARERLSAE
jgi:heme exporter protein C